MVDPSIADRTVLVTSFRAADAPTATESTNRRDDNYTPTGAAVNVNQVSAPAIPLEFLSGGKKNSPRKGSILNRLGPRR